MRIHNAVPSKAAAVNPLKASSARRLRVSIITETYPPEINGVAMTMRHMVAGLHDRGHDVELIRPTQHAGDRPLCAARLNEHLVRGCALPRYDSLKIGFPAGRLQRRLWSARRPDVVHVVTEGPLGWSAVTAARRLGIPCSSDFHTNFHSYSTHYGIGWMRSTIAAYLRTLHNRTASTFVPTASLLEELARDGYRNVSVVARGVDTRQFDPAKRSDALREQWQCVPGHPVVLSVGRLAPEKNLPAVITTFRAIQALRPQARLVIVGDGPVRKRLQSANPDVIFAGMRIDEDLARHYASGDIFLCPSITETFGNVIVEAMASGLPIVAYDYAAAAQYLTHDESAMLARFDHVQQFIDCAVDVAADPLRARRLAHRARRLAEKIDWQDVHDEFEMALLRVAEGASPASARKHAD